MIPQRHARLFSLLSAWAELVGYVGSITLCALRIAAALERERALTEELHRRKKVCALQVLAAAAKGTCALKAHAKSRFCIHAVVWLARKHGKRPWRQVNSFPMADGLIYKAEAIEVMRRTAGGAGQNCTGFEKQLFVGLGWGFAELIETRCCQSEDTVYYRDV